MKKEEAINIWQMLWTTSEKPEIIGAIQRSESINL